MWTSIPESLKVLYYIEQEQVLRGFLWSQTEWQYRGHIPNCQKGNQLFLYWICDQLEHKVLFRSKQAEGTVINFSPGDHNRRDEYGEEIWAENIALFYSNQTV